MLPRIYPGITGLWLKRVLQKSTIKVETGAKAILGLCLQVCNNSLKARKVTFKSWIITCSCLRALFLVPPCQVYHTGQHALFLFLLPLLEILTQMLVSWWGHLNFGPQVLSPLYYYLFCSHNVEHFLRHMDIIGLIIYCLHPPPICTRPQRYTQRRQQHKAGDCCSVSDISQALTPLSGM